MDTNPHESPQERCTAASPRQGRREVLPRPLVRLATGVFGGLFLVTALMAALGARRLWMVEMFWLPLWIAAGVAVGWTVFSRRAVVRTCG